MSKKIEKITKKKISKKAGIFAVVALLIVIAIIIFLNIGKKSEGINYINKTTSNFRTILKSNKYYMEVYTTDKNFNVEDKKLVICKNGSEVCMVADKISIVMKGEYIYAISHADKTILQATADTSNIDFGFSKFVNSNMTGKGTKKIGDKKYKYEDYNGTKLYYYNGKVEYLESGTSILKVDKISDQIDEKLFEIPSDYKITTKD